jgi:hypothetical protein
MHTSNLALHDATAPPIAIKAHGRAPIAARRVGPLARLKGVRPEPRVDRASGKPRETPVAIRRPPRPEL